MISSVESNGKVRRRDWRSQVQKLQERECFLIIPLSLLAVTFPKGYVDSIRMKSKGVCGRLEK